MELKVAVVVTLDWIIGAEIEQSVLKLPTWLMAGAENKWQRKRK